MAEDNKRLLILGSKSRGDAVWGQITGTLSDQTDLKDALDTKADTSSIPTKTSDLANDSGFITLSDVPVQVQADWDETDTTDPSYIQNKPTIPDPQVQADWNEADTTDPSYIQNKPTIPDSTSDLTNDSGFITLSDVPAQVQADWNEADTTDPSYIQNKPTIPTVNDATITLEDSSHTTIDSFTLNQSSNKTITIPSGGGNAWYGTQEMFDIIPAGQLDQNTTYYISGKLDYEKDLTNKPFVPTDTNQLTNGADFQNSTQVSTQVSTDVMSGLGYLDKTNVYLTQTEFDTMRTAGTLKQGYTYHIQGDMTTVQMLVTFTDQSTATYDVFVKA